MTDEEILGAFADYQRRWEDPSDTTAPEELNAQFDAAWAEVQRVDPARKWDFDDAGISAAIECRKSGLHDALLDHIWLQSEFWGDYEKPEFLHVKCALTGEEECVHFNYAGEP